MEEIPNNHRLDVWNHANNGIFAISTGEFAGFLNHQQYVMFFWDLLPEGNMMICPSKSRGRIQPKTQWSGTDRSSRLSIYLHPENLRFEIDGQEMMDLETMVFVTIHRIYGYYLGDLVSSKRNQQLHCKSNCQFPLTKTAAGSVVVFFNFAKFQEFVSRIYSNPMMKWFTPANWINWRTIGMVNSSSPLLSHIWWLAHPYQMNQNRWSTFAVPVAMDGGGIGDDASRTWQRNHPFGCPPFFFTKEETPQFTKKKKTRLQRIQPSVLQTTREKKSLTWCTFEGSDQCHESSWHFWENRSDLFFVTPPPFRLQPLEHLSLVLRLSEVASRLWPSFHKTIQ